MKRVLYVLPALALSLAACSSNKSTATAPSTSAATTTSAAAAASTTSAAATTPAAPASSSVAAPTSAPAASSPAASTPAATSPAAPSSASPAPVSTKPAVPDVKAQVLALGDLPPGWSKHKVDNSTAGEPACFKVLKADKHEPVAKAQVEYQGSPQGLPSLDEEIAYDPKVAAAQFNKAVKALDGCGKITVKANGTTLSGAMGAMSFPKMGDQSKAYQLTLSGVVNGIRVTVGFDILLLRVGTEDVSLLYSTIGAPDIREFQGATKLVLNKINGPGTTA